MDRPADQGGDAPPARFDAVPGVGVPDVGTEAAGDHLGKGRRIAVELKDAVKQGRLAEVVA